MRDKTLIDKAEVVEAIVKKLQRLSPDRLARVYNEVMPGKVAVKGNSFKKLPMVTTAAKQWALANGFEVEEGQHGWWWDGDDVMGSGGFKTQEEAWADLVYSCEIDRQMRGLPCSWDMS
jgi:hypothetical protein